MVSAYRCELLQLRLLIVAVRLESALGLSKLGEAVFEMPIAESLLVEDEVDGAFVRTGDGSPLGLARHEQVGAARRRSEELARSDDPNLLGEATGEERESPDRFGPDRLEVDLEHCCRCATNVSCVLSRREAGKCRDAPVK